MSDKPKSDIVMKFIQNGNNPVFAECALDKESDDTLMKGFEPQTYDNYSNFFEVTKFSFGMDVKDEDKTKKTMQQSQVSSAKSAGVGQAGTRRVEGEFATWRSAKDDQVRKLEFPLEFKNFSFERLIDSASPIFFEACCSSTTFPSVTLVKRVSRGGNRRPEGFLRIDFKDVLIVSLSWDDGEMTTEKCEFICRHFDLQYRQQQADGSFSAMVPAKWDYLEDAKPTP